MMRTLRDMNMSKFVAEDVPLFLALIDDLFPNVKAERTQFEDIMGALKKASNLMPPKEGGFFALTLWIYADFGLSPMRSTHSLPQQPLPEFHAALSLMWSRAGC